MTQQPPPDTAPTTETPPAETAPPTPPETGPIQPEPMYTVDDLVRAAPTSGMRALIRVKFKATGKTGMTHDEAAAFLQTITGGH